MDLTIGTFQLPVSAMNIFNNITILCLVPYFDQVVYPILSRRWGYRPSMLTKIGVGFVLAMLAMLVAGFVEVGGGDGGGLFVGVVM